MNSIDFALYRYRTPQVFRFNFLRRLKNAELNNLDTRGWPADYAAQVAEERRDRLMSWTAGVDPD